jgi:hypothetical protein
MTIRDVQFSFTDTAAGASTSIVGAAGTYLAPNSIDTAPLGAYLTELTANDTQLSPSVNTFRDLGGGERLWLVVDWITAPLGGTSADVQLITSASSSMSSPVIMYDFSVQVIANLTGPTQYGKYVRQIAALPRSLSWLEWLGIQAVTVGTMTAGAYVAWIGKDVDAAALGYVSGFSIK